VDLMNNQLTPVQPGDLITADFMNRVLDALGVLDSRVTALETSGVVGSTVAISGLSTQTAHIGDELRVFGRNFGDPGQDTVIIDGSATVNAFKQGSGDGLLIFDIPAVQGIPTEGRAVSLYVSTQKGSATTTFTLLPKPSSVPIGTLSVTLSQSPPDAQLNPGNAYTFVFTVRANTNMDEVYTLAPSVVATQNQAGWQAIVVDQSNNPAAPQIGLPGTSPRDSSADVRVRVTIPSGTDGSSAQLTLTVTSQRNPTQLTNSSGNIALTVGSAPPPPNKIPVSFVGVAGSGSLDGNTIVVKPDGSLAAITVKAVLPQAGTYTVAPPTIQNNTGNLWQAQLRSSSSVTATAANTETTILIALSAAAGAPATALVASIVLSTDSTVTGQLSRPIRTA
jgi:hypothetical protein